jgi:soluble lytic murein transglycosylase
MIRLLLAAVFLAGPGSAITLEEIEPKEPSRAKNFLIWQYFQQDITPEQADRAFYQIRDVDRKLFFAYADKTGDTLIKQTAECMKLTGSEIVKTKEHDCARIALAPYKIASLSIKERQDLLQDFAGEEEEKWLKMMADDALPEHLEDYDPKLFLYISNSAGRTFRQENFNKRISESYMKRLSKSPGFSTFVLLAATDPKMDKLHHALSVLDGADSGAGTNFFLAMNQLRFGQKNPALRHLDIVYRKSYFRMDKDKALFWAYLITENPKYLRQLSRSFDLNIYSLYAKELTGTPIDNYYTILKTVDEPTELNLKDPFVWLELLKKTNETPRDKLFELSRQYRNKALMPLQSFIVERAFDYKIQNFITPYAKSMAQLSNEDKALMYALMKQESRFIPSALSSSYALGLMQLMPFLVKALDKDAEKPRNSLSEMFEPERNIAYASRHIAWLKESLYHPLFIAYAYNGGIGFTRRHLLDGTFRSGKYEPFFSMEMMANSQSREYGKKVLANYVIYKKIYGQPVSILHLFETLTQPSRTDRFRK